MTAALTGLKVLDFTHGVAGPLASMILADLGCEVVKVEHPRRGDATRYMNVSQRFTADIPRVGGDYFMSINRNKKSLTLNLKSDAGVGIARDLFDWADVTMQSFRPGVMERLGLGYQDAREQNPGIIYSSLSAYGQHGPLAGHPGMDIAVQARSGAMSIVGPSRDGGPLKAGASIADFSGGTHFAIAIQAAVIHKLRTGEGQFLSVSLLDAMTTMLSNYSVAVLDGGAYIEPVGSGHPQLVPFQAFATADGYVVVGPGTNKLFREFCRALDLDHMIDDSRFASNEDRVANRDACIAPIAAVVATKNTDEWLSRFEASGVPAAPVLTLGEAFRQEQVVANEMVVRLEHPDLGHLSVIGSPYKLSASPPSIRTAPPRLGEHTDEFLHQALGLSASQLGELHEKGAI